MKMHSRFIVSFVAVEVAIPLHHGAPIEPIHRHNGGLGSQADGQTRYSSSAPRDLLGRGTEIGPDEADH